MSVSDYYPFGYGMPSRTIQSNSYRYGFNGKEKDENNEWGDQTHYDYGFRIYNPAIARFLSVDPLFKEYPWYTPYQFAGNKPIWAIDLDGLEEKFIKDMEMRRWKPVIDGDYSVVERADNAAYNTISMVVNIGIGLRNGVTSAISFPVDVVQGDYDGVTGTDVMVAMDHQISDFANDAYEYHTETPISQQLSDFADASLNLDNWQTAIQLLLFQKVPGGGFKARANTLPPATVTAPRLPKPKIDIPDDVPPVQLGFSFSKRRKYMGKTPSKKSNTGKEVRERMRKEGTVKRNKSGEDIFKDKTDKKWRKVDTPTTHMGHKEAAVTWYNRVGRFLNKKMRRMWMRWSKNYEFEHGPNNSRAGGKMKERYKDPKDK